MNSRMTSTICIVKRDPVNVQSGFYCGILDVEDPRETVKHDSSVFAKMSCGVYDGDEKKSDISLSTDPCDIEKTVFEYGERDRLVLTSEYKKSKHEVDILLGQSVSFVRYEVLSTLGNLCFSVCKFVKRLEATRLENEGRISSKKKTLRFRIIPAPSTRCNEYDDEEELISTVINSRFFSDTSSMSIPYYHYLDVVMDSYVECDANQVIHFTATFTTKSRFAPTINSKRYDSIRSRTFEFFIRLDRIHESEEFVNLIIFSDGKYITSGLFDSFGFCTDSSVKLFFKNHYPESTEHHTEFANIRRLSEISSIPFNEELIKDKYMSLVEVYNSKPFELSKDEESPSSFHGPYTQKLDSEREDDFMTDFSEDEIPIPYSIDYFEPDPETIRINSGNGTIFLVEEDQEYKIKFEPLTYFDISVGKAVPITKKYKAVVRRVAEGGRKVTVIGRYVYKNNGQKQRLAKDRRIFLRNEELTFHQMYTIEYKFAKGSPLSECNVLQTMKFDERRKKIWIRSQITGKDEEYDPDIEYHTLGYDKIEPSERK